MHKVSLALAVANALSTGVKLNDDISEENSDIQEVHHAYRALREMLTEEQIAKLTTIEETLRELNSDPNLVATPPEMLLNKAIELLGKVDNLNIQWNNFTENFYLK